MTPTEQLLRRVVRDAHRELSCGGGAVFSGEEYECTPYASEVIDRVHDRLDRRVARHTIALVVAEEQLRVRG